MDIFETCHEVNDLLAAKQDHAARDTLIRLLDYLQSSSLSYDPVVNHLIRATGLFPYLQPETADWEDRFVSEAFKVDVGGQVPATLHREQSALLSRLLKGENLAVSAPTSFGKSFIIDAFISIRTPKNIVIIVPTLALTDETRRRLHKKFSRYYKVITTPGVELSERNLFVFPQERAASYIEQLPEIDLLVIDEFYKASPSFDRERSPALLKAMLRLGNKARQRYFLAPNISAINESPFTTGMEFVPLDFNTVYLEKHNLFEEIGRDAVRKSEVLMGILSESRSKTLIYAGTYSNIDRLANLLTNGLPIVERGRLRDFSRWLSTHYDPNWQLTNLVKRGTGIHNGQLHRSLSQIQVRLFEEEDEGLTNLISTSSIIEGVNTSAENVVLWSNKKGQPRLDDFTYRNIVGRGGRMFRHFVGKIYILEAPPKPADTQLNLSVPDELLGITEEQEYGDTQLTKEQIARIIEYREEMREMLGEDSFRRLQRADAFQSSDSAFIRRVTRDIVENREEWARLGALNSTYAFYWDRMLYRIINLRPGGWDAKYGQFVEFIKILSENWNATIPDLLFRLDEHDIGIELFFKLERNASFKFAALLNDVNLIQKEALGRGAADISPFIARISHAFLPPLVYQLEEYGLPRMVAKKIQGAGVFDFTNEETTLHDAIERLNRLGFVALVDAVPTLDGFDRYILEYFFDGIMPNEV